MLSLNIVYNRLPMIIMHHHNHYAPSFNSKLNLQQYRYCMFGKSIIAHNLNENELVY